MTELKGGRMTRDSPRFSQQEKMPVIDNFKSAMVTFQQLMSCLDSHCELTKATATRTNETVGDNDMLTPHTAIFTVNLLRPHLVLGLINLFWA